MAKGPRERSLGLDEAELFRASLRDAKPLRRRKEKPREEPAAPPPSPPPPPKRDAPRPPLSPATPLPPLAHGSAPGLDKRTHERFRKGEMEIDATLDLHGMTQDAAHAVLLRFVGRAAESGLRCVLIVTGKGGREGTGILRAQVPRWLNEAALRPYLLAIHRARPRHGGEGALYVLLKRKR